MESLCRLFSLDTRVEYLNGPQANRKQTHADKTWKVNSERAIETKSFNESTVSRHSIAHILNMLC